MKTEKILVPTDFSRRSLAALERAIDLAREHYSEIVLVHVIEPLPYAAGSWSDSTQLLAHCAEDRRSQLARLTKRAVALYPKCTSEVHFGILHEAISELARKLDVDLIVVAARSHHGFFERIRVSLAERLLRHAPCPVLAVPVGGGVEKENQAAARIN
ncbi:MAG: universal stress protein [Candidatus Binatus sp.]|jgi:nucleotide-binding universal stress UspA family protein|uniref:universal stress protein n=1 Tax=Candidatus Binatus sp. TaxID=2811406 RepID=UPI003C968810